MTNTAKSNVVPANAAEPVLADGLLYILSWAAGVAIIGGFLAWLQWGDLSLGTKAESLLSYKFLPVATATGLMSAGLYLAWAVWRRSWLARAGWWWLFLTAVSMAGLLVDRTWETYQVLELGHWGMTNLYEVSILIVVCMATVASWLMRQGRWAALGAFLAPILVAAFGFILWLADIGQAGPRPLVPSLQSYWLPFHVLANFIGYGCFAVAGAAGGMHLWRWRQDRRGVPSRLPTQEEAERLTFQAIAVGFPVFTIAVILGSLWAYDAWGGYWQWDPKETWALIVWLVYGGYLHARMSYRPGDIRLAIWALVGFAVTLFCYLGVNMFLSGLHSYGQLA